MIKNRFHQLQLLRISISDNEAYLDANRWQKLILTSMPFLRIFDFQHKQFVHKFPAYEDHYHALINQFNSSFWSERQWFFAHQHYIQGCVGRAIFYSIHPYRYENVTFFIRISDMFFFFETKTL